MSRRTVTQRTGPVYDMHDIDESGPNGEARSVSSKITITSSTSLQTVRNSSAIRETSIQLFKRIHFFSDSNLRVLITAMKRLGSNKRYKGSGYVYLCHSPNLSNVVHIGITTKPEVVMKLRRSRCDPATQLIAQFHSRNVHRLEYLVHQDLNSQHRCMRCRFCSYLHKELFEVSEQLAVDTVRRWVMWMDTEPYNKLGELKQSWMLQLHGSESPKTKEELYKVLECRLPEISNFTE
jgi:hypothetical protein